MARPLRIEFSGAFYHITSRGNAREAIYLDDNDREYFLELLTTACKRFNWRCHSFCLMDNHYHLLIETVDSSLSKGMKFINGSYTQKFNRHHNRVGHVFQGRYKAILVEQDSYLLELSRYIVLNPVRAMMVRSAKDWPWSSYRAIAGLSKPLDLVTVESILSCFGSTVKKAQLAYREFVRQGRGQSSPLDELKNQIFLGSDSFVEDMQCKMDPEQSLDGIPKSQKLAPKQSLDVYLNLKCPKKEAMARAYLSGHYNLTEVGSHFGVSYATVSRSVKVYECQM